MKKTIYEIWSKFLTTFGNVKVFSWPMFLVYDPDDYAVSGKQVLDIIDVI